MSVLPNFDFLFTSFAGQFRNLDDCLKQFGFTKLLEHSFSDFIRWDARVEDNAGNIAQSQRGSIQIFQGP